MSDARTSPLWSLVLLALACRAAPPVGPDTSAAASPEPASEPGPEPKPDGLDERGLERSDYDDGLEFAVSDPQVSMRMLVTVDDAWMAAAPGATVYTGDHVRFAVTLHHPTCIYLIFANDRREAGVLFPEPNEQPCMDAGLVMIPPRNSERPTIKVTGEPTLEVIHLLASSKPLETLDQQLTELVASVRENGTADDQLVPKPVKNGKAVNRKRVHHPTEGHVAFGPSIDRRGDPQVRADGASVDGRLGTDGILVISYPFLHLDLPETPSN